MTLKKFFSFVFYLTAICISVGGFIDLAESCFNVTSLVNIDTTFVLFCVSLAIVFITSLAGLIRTFFSDKTIWALLLIIPLALFIRFDEPNFNKYQQNLIPMSQSDFMKLVPTDTRKDDDYVYVYRSDCYACDQFKPKLTHYLNTSDNSIGSFDLNKAKKQLSSTEYQKLIHKLNLKALPAFIYFGIKQENVKSNYTVTFNNLNDPKVFKQYKHFMGTLDDVKSNKNVIETVNN